MSHNASRSNSHGFCDAIFSTSPIRFGKENKTPIKEAPKVSRNTSDEVRTTIKNQMKSYKSPCSKHKLLLKNDTVQQTETIKRLLNTDNAHSKSTHVLQKHESFVSTNLTKTPMKTGSLPKLSDDKTGTLHFCTSKLVKSNVLPINKTPIKKYLSDHNLSQVTPDCFNKVQLETSSTPIPNKSHDVVDEGTIYDGESSNLTVGVRVRPLNLKELSEPKISSVVKIDGQNVTVECEMIQHTFMYDHCFVSYGDTSIPGHASQETVFNTMVLPLVQNAFEGYNVCLFAYGQTGSGKSYSMMGLETQSEENCTTADKEAGIIPRFCEEIFMCINKNKNVTTNVEISYFEIYNEKIHDLLASTNSGEKKAALKVREHPVFGPYIVDLSQHSIKNYKDLQIWLKVGNSQRVTAATGMNEKSSRSHSIFSIILTQNQSHDQLSCTSIDSSRRSKINLVDLAGSERLSQTCASGNRLREGVSINKSLLTLGKVIASLAENTNNRKRGFVPYRESVLTWLLKESLGGNSRTAMLGTVSPANIHVEETLSTLRYACQARAIVNRVRVNEDPHDRLIRELKAEVLRLRGVREGYEKQIGAFPRRLLDCMEPPCDKNSEEVQRKQEEIDKLKDQLRKTEEQLVATQKRSSEKLREAEEKKKFELKYLRRCGIAVEIDFLEKHKQPCLINLAADPMLSGTLLYLIPPGLVRIGKSREVGTSFKPLDIVLDGPLIKQLHCTIENNNGKLILLPEMEGDTYVNGQVVTGKINLKHGDRLVIGGNHYFKVSNPHDDYNNMQLPTQAIDFEFAHQEILRIQEEKLRAELEESKQKAIKELENAKREVELQLGSQKSTYEQKIEDLGSTLEEQKLAFEEINRRKQELELEKEILANELETNNRIRRIQMVEGKMTVSPYKSNFLQELEGILNETTADAETALKIKISANTIEAGGMSLHEMQILVREATERCKEVGINYEFSQQQTIVEKSLKPVIRVRDKDRKVETLWQPMRFLDWIHQLRDYDVEHSLKEFQNSEDEWQPFNESEIFEDSLNASRISINLTPVKKHLNESFQQLSMDVSTQEECSKTNIYQENDEIGEWIFRIENATQSLSKLCRHQGNSEIGNKVSESLNKMQSIVLELRNTLNMKDLKQTTFDESVNSNNSLNNTVIEKENGANCTLLVDNDSISTVKADTKTLNSPIKSNLRNNGANSSHVRNGNVQKNVRFTDKIQHHLT